MAVVFEGKEEVSRFVAVTLKSGLKLYRKTGMKPNRAWTPTNMLRKTEEITGKKFKRGQYLEAEQALEKWLVENSHEHR